MSKKIVHGAEARNYIKQGVDMVANTVKVTLGPKGRSVVLGKSFGSPHITNDGVSIAKEISLSDKAQNLGVELIKEVASKTVDVAGDGTTTATVLAQSILDEGLRLVESGANPLAIKRGLKKGVAAIVKELQKQSQEISTKEDIRRVAYISSQDETIADSLAEIYDKIGKDGVLTIENGQTFGITTKYVEGMTFNKGYISPYFITDSETQTATIDNPYILVTDKKISNVKTELLPLIDQILQSGKKDLVIIAEDVEGEALASLVLNRLKGVLNVVAIKAPSFGDTKKGMLNDIALLTGGTYLTEDIGQSLEHATLADLGSAKKVIVKKDETIIVDGKGDAKEIERRVKEISAQAHATQSEHDKKSLLERVAKLQGGVAVLEIGAATEVEQKLLKDAVDDAQSAVVSALEEGIVAGGGVALVEARDVLQKIKCSAEEKIGIDLLYKAVTLPFKQIVENAGVNGDVVLDKKNNMDDGYGFDAYNEEYVHMIESGIIDPVKVCRMALENAASICEVALTTEALVIDEDDEKENGGGMPHMPQGGFPGMM